MTRTNLLGLYVSIALLAGGGGFYLQRHFAAQTPPSIPDDMTALPRAAMDGLQIGALRPVFSLPDLDGQLHAIEEWDGKVVLLNFWATWCPPCVREVPEFVRLRADYADKGLEIIGIAIDRADAVKAFAAQMEINYPLLHGQGEASEVARNYGNRIGTLPYSVLIDRDGKIQYVHALGELDYDTVETLIKPLL